MKRVLSLDGGGVKGIMQMKALSVLENYTGKPIRELFDLVIGTSVGALNGAMLCVGDYTAIELVDVMHETLPVVFKRRHLKRAKYSKEPLKIKLAELFPDGCLGAAATKLVITSYEDTEGRMHFFKSWEKHDGLIGLFDAVDRSSAAPLYFGPVVDFTSHRVWLDGGVGMFNNPGLYAYVDAHRLGWLGEGVQCVSVGNGYVDHTRTFEDSANASKLTQLLNFISPEDGGMARRNAPQVISDFLYNLDDDVRWKFKRVDVKIDKKIERMDGVKYIDQYIEKGVQLGGFLCEAWG